MSDSRDSSGSNHVGSHTNRDSFGSSHGRVREWREYEATDWIETELGRSKPEDAGDLWAWLKNGKVLCELINTLRPGTIKKVKDSTFAFKQLENISKFLCACREEFGVADGALFDSLDLYDNKGPQQVLFALNALRKAAIKMNDLPYSSRDSMSPMATKKSLPSMFKQRKSNSVVLDPDYVPTASQASASHQAQGGDQSELTDGGVATVVRGHDADDKDEITVFIGDVVHVKLSKGGWCFAEENEGWVLVQKGSEQGLVPGSCLKAGLGEDTFLSAGQGRGSNKPFSIGMELAAKAAAMYDPVAEALAQHWIEQVTGTVFRKPFGEEIKDGVLLCRLVNEITPGSVPKPYEGPIAFRQMDNIANFLEECKRLGADTFDTTDLYEARNLNPVVQCLYSLSTAIMKSVPDYHGPLLTGQGAGFNDAVMSNLRVIVAVGEYRDRNRHQRLADEASVTGSEASSHTEDLVSEAVEYRLAMLGLRDSQFEGANVQGVDRSQMEPAFLVLWSSSTKSSLKMEGDERRLVHLLTAKGKRYEMVYIDVSPERKVELAAIAGKETPLPALTFGAHYHGPFQTIQELEDEGRLDELVEPASDGEGFWALPEAWGVTSSMLEGGGLQVINEVPC